MSAPTVTTKKSLQPIDRVALGVIIVLSLLIGILLLSGNHTKPRVRDFSWQERQIGAEDTGFVLTFSRPMNHASVADNLKVNQLLPGAEPPQPEGEPIEGKISWAGRRMAFTFNSPLPYGSKYQVQLEGAKDDLPHIMDKEGGTEMEPFNAVFRTRDRIFAYIGIEGEEEGKLILYNLTQQQRTTLTPQDLLVTDFKIYPDGEQILFSATDPMSQSRGLLAEQLYNVTTGISFQSPTKKSKLEPAGKINRILDNQDYQNLKFDLSNDGKTIVVQRVNRQNPADFGLWIIQPDAKPRPLENEPGGNFLITPDSNSIAVAQGQGVAILPLTPSAKPLDFLPKFGVVLSFARDGSAATMVKFNADYTRSLFLVTNQGDETELLRTTGSINSCEFNPNKEILYCLLTQLIEGEEYVEEPFIAAIALEAVKNNGESPVKPLVVLPEQRDIKVSLSSDGLALLFDQIVSTTPSANNSLRSDEGQAITDAVLWLLPVVDSTSSQSPIQLQPEELLSGFKPRWLP
ncbi:MAG: Ig-like domain-containing protein [Symploca sp. SIO2G7]|nr:Ig-like domain-containing protein [Symploca sp. SIO2G7]